jgi:hypothetical protein
MESKTVKNFVRNVIMMETMKSFQKSSTENMTFHGEIRAELKYLYQRVTFLLEDVSDERRKFEEINSI